MNREEHLGVTGQDNIRILENCVSIIAAGKEVRPRFPFIPGINDSAENLRELNSLKYEEQLFEFNIKLNNLMFKYGMIFPEKEVKTLKETIKDDF